MQHGRLIWACIGQDEALMSTNLTAFWPPPLMIHRVDAGTRNCDLSATPRERASSPRSQLATPPATAFGMPDLDGTVRQRPLASAVRPLKRP